MKLAALAILAAALAPACGGSRNDCSIKFSDPPKLSEIQREIFDRSCAFNGCHGGTNTQPKAGPMLLTAGNAHTSLLTTSVERPSGPRVLKGNPSTSYLTEKLTSDMPTDGVRMPNGANPLCEAEVETIKRWIAVGALND